MQCSKLYLDFVIHLISSQPRYRLHSNGSWAGQRCGQGRRPRSGRM